MTKPNASALDQLTLDDVRAAHARIGDAVVRTPMLKSQTLSQIAGAEIWLKFENLQFTAAYKERGALNALLLMSEEARARGVIAASAGNHSQGLSYHGSRLGVPVTIVMPRTTPAVKVMQTEAVGGDVVLEGDSFDEAYAHARQLEKERGLTFVHPFDDPNVAAGAGTVALEMLEDKPDLDCLVVPIGGGGLMSGMATVAKAINPDIHMVGVEASLFPSMHNVLSGADNPTGGDTLAGGAGNDTYLVSTGNDVIFAGEGLDTLSIDSDFEIEDIILQGNGDLVFTFTIDDSGDPLNGEYTIDELTAVHSVTIVNHVAAPLHRISFDDDGAVRTILMASNLQAANAEDTGYANVFDAAASGAASGMQLALNVGAMLLAFIALIAMFNGLIGWTAGLFGYENVTFEGILGYVLQPLAWAIGVPWEEAQLAGSFIGQKMVVNEFVAYLNFLENQSQLSEASQAIITFALCGFANFSSIAILMGGIGAMAPTRRKEIARLGLKAVIAATLSNLMSAALAGFYLSLG